MSTRSGDPIIISSFHQGKTETSKISKSASMGRKPIRVDKNINSARCCVISGFTLTI